MTKDKQARRENLTKKFVDKLKLPSEKPEFIWDTELVGFGAKLNPTSIVYIVQGRVKGKTKRVKIGKHGPFTVKQARDSALDLLRDMSKGIDPIAERKRDRYSQVTLKQLVDAYIKDRELKLSSVNDINKHIDGVFSDWKDKSIVNITKQVVLKRFREKSNYSKAQANLAFRILRALLNYARATYRQDDTPILPENPCQILLDAKMWHNIQPKNRRIPQDKVGKAWNKLQEMRSDQSRTAIGQNTASAVAFTLLTGARWGEVSKLAWERVNLESKTWYIPDPKNKQLVTMPLSNQAIEILKEQNQDSYYVFAGRGKTGYVGKPVRVMRSISETVGETISVHDSRRTFRAIAAECDIELWRCKLLLNHKLNGDVTLASYTEKSDLRYLAEDAQKIGDWIEHQAMIASKDNVIDLEEAKNG